MANWQTGPLARSVGCYLYNVVTRRKLERRSISVDAYFDIETQNWDTFVLGGFYSLESGFEEYRHQNQDSLVERILSVNGSVWAHNGGKYDTLWLLSRFLRYCRPDELEIIEEMEVLDWDEPGQIHLAGQRIVCLKIGKCEIRDSAALMPMALEQAAKIGGGEKQKTGLDCICGKTCGGYCAIKIDMPETELQKLSIYLKADCIVGFRALTFLASYAESRDIDLCSTVGSSAWRTARRWANLPEATWKLPGVGESTMYHFARLGYYGGRTQVFRLISSFGYHCDVNSAYPNALRTLCLPIGRMSHGGPKHTRKKWDKGAPGIYQATVDIPAMHIPPLPYRGKNRIYYPIGRVDGVWAQNELAYAESVGCSIVDVHRSVTWDETANIFKAPMEEFWRLRDEAGPKTALGVWLKFLGNSLTGKMAQHPLAEIIELNVKEPKFCPADFDCHVVLCGGDFCCPHACVGLCGRHVPLDSEQLIWSSKRWQMPTCGHVHWAAYLTAHQRTYLHAQLIDDGIGGLSAVYCDTDSCFSEERRTKNIGKNLGEWKDEGAYTDFLSLAPKTYSYLDEDGKRETRAKGIYEPEKNWEALKAGSDIIIDRGVKSLKSAIRDGNLFGRKNMSRHIKERMACEICHEVHIGDRLLDGALTRPMDMTIVRQHEGRSVRRKITQAAP